MRAAAALFLALTTSAAPAAQEAVPSKFEASPRPPDTELGRATSDSTSPSITIRLVCGPSLSDSNEPLFVVDGVTLGGNSPWGPRSLAELEPSDIESVSVLTGAEAERRYGALAQNGVVIITTRAAHVVSDAGVVSQEPYPNPASPGDLVTLPVAPGVPARAEVFDALGRRVLTIEAPGRGAGVQVPTAGLSAGVYVVRVAGPDGAATHRVTVR